MGTCEAEVGARRMRRRWPVFYSGNGTMCVHACAHMHTCAIRVLGALWGPPGHMKDTGME